ncbi:hypothetical protein DFA_04985 [Cavenderia fasciculata]|uniref:Uncharacterized protein n=1 Tax=Cavenderia fasciculata TaxID=261658 RepID=F4PMQ8_CACFS|nr:uncharacterized protein DFA_04985 [Cavenderia fasciculata]EGG22855.1 hypothetical protein DFA_04985 [Cavenderia fasciculata]|eukprot:XP_004360706.1 hypothetical protein DFA_04985 [Cavenderia fasciculata]
MYSNNSDKINNHSDKRRTEFFKSILNNKYPRTKIFKDVEIIHDMLYSCDGGQGQPMIYRLKSHEIISLEEFIIPPFYPTSNRSQISNTIDRVIQNYSRFYNGPERDQYQMQPLRLYNPNNIHTSRDPFNTYYIISKYRHDPQFNQIINFNDFDINQFYNKNQSIGLIPFIFE